jgi:preprotein translocase subunit SecG
MKKATIILLVIFLLVLSIAISYIILDVVNNSDNTE